LVAVYFLRGIFYAALPDIEHKFVQGSLRQSIFLIGQNQNRRLLDPPSIILAPSSILNNSGISKVLKLVLLYTEATLVNFLNLSLVKK